MRKYCVVTMAIILHLRKVWGFAEKVEIQKVPHLSDSASTKTQREFLLIHPWRLKEQITYFSN